LLKQKHDDFYRGIEEMKHLERGETLKDLERAKSNATQTRLNKVMNIVSEIQDQELLQTSLQEEQVRQYICNTLTPVISDGLLRIVEIKPKDPVDYLAEYLFERSFEF
jgi:hypothetical protein